MRPAVIMVNEDEAYERVVVLGVEEEKVVEGGEVLEGFTIGKIPEPGCVQYAVSMTLFKQQVPQQSGLAATATGDFLLQRKMFDGRKIDPIFQVVSQILYKTEVCRGRFQLWASSQGLPVQLAPADPVKSTIFKSPSLRLGLTQK